MSVLYAVLDLSCVNIVQYLPYIFKVTSISHQRKRQLRFPDSDESQSDSGLLPKEGKIPLLPVMVETISKFSLQDQRAERPKAQPRSGSKSALLVFVL